MKRRVEGEFMHWTPRIVVRRFVKEEIEELAREDVRSVAATIGILLHEAITARSSA